MRSSFWLPAYLAFGWLVGCSAEPKNHAPFIGGGCLTPPCAVDHPVGSGPRSDAGTQTLADGGQGTSSLTGFVTVFRDNAFVNRAAFGGEGVITVLGTHKVVGSISGQSYTLNNADFLKTLWADIRATSGGTDLMETIAPIDGTQTNVEVTFGRLSDLASIAAGLTLTPLSLETTNHAQIVLRFVNAAGAGVIGVQITQSVGAPVAYDLGASYSDTVDATQARGIAVLVNVAPPGGGVAFPGTPVTITYKAGVTAALGTVQVYAVAGALTIADVLVK